VGVDAVEVDDLAVGWSVGLVGSVGWVVGGAEVPW
jgi:hypothetical protein